MQPIVGCSPWGQQTAGASCLLAAGRLVANRSPPSMRQMRHAMARLHNKALFRQTIELHCNLSRQSRHAPVVEVSGTAPICSSSASAGSPAALQSLQPEIKQMESAGQLRTTQVLAGQLVCRASKLRCHIAGSNPAALLRCPPAGAAQAHLHYSWLSSQAWCPAVH